MSFFPPIYLHGFVYRHDVAGCVTVLLFFFRAVSWFGYFGVIEETDDSDDFAWSGVVAHLLAIKLMDSLHTVSDDIFAIQRFLV